MYDYALPNGLPNGSRAVWSNLPLQPLIHGPLTPFSYSVLAEIAGRAWYLYFDQLGFDPMPRARVLRQYEGRPYLNLTISAQRDVEGAGVEPLTLRLDGQPFAVCKWEKPGLLAGFKFSLAQNKIDQQSKALAADLGAITQAAQGWYAKIAELRWTQAEVLQIMEEIEQAGTRSFVALLAARHQLDLAYNRLIRLTAQRVDFPANLALIDGAIGQPDGLVEGQIAEQLTSLGRQFAAVPAALAWLSGNPAADWANTLAEATLATTLQNFLTQYGHRCIGEGEIRQPRWVDDPAQLWPLLQAIAAGKLDQPVAPQAVQPLLEAVENSRRKEAQQWLQKIPQLHRLQSGALHAFAYILAGARRWALAAARDALADGRLLTPDDVFFYELEEMKEMMTGEWNISSRTEIQHTARKRRAEYSRWQQATPTELLVGESEARGRAVDLPTSFTGGLADWLGRL